MIAKTAALFTVLLLGAVAAPAQGILLNDGRRVTAKSLRRQGDNIMAQSPRVEGAKELQGEVGFPLSQIEKLEFPEPAVLRTAPDLIAQGKAAEALAALDGPMAYYAGFREAPGSFWPDLAIYKLMALVALGKDADAEPLARQVTQQASNKETVQAAQAHLAGITARRGDHEKAIGMLDQVLASAADPRTLAAAAVNKANSHYALKQWNRALLSYMQIPVFYPEQKAFIPQYMLGAGRCFFALDDFPRAKAKLGEVIKTFAGTNEATLAQAELDKIAQREKALEVVK